MVNTERMSIEAGGDALRHLADELALTHGEMFSACFFEEHWEAIERVIERLVNDD